MDDTSAFGVTVFLPTCTFELEVPKMGLNDFYTKIENYFDAAGVPQEIETRASEAVIDVAEIAAMMVHGLADNEQAATSIAYKFIYAYMKRNLSIEKTCGLVAMIRDEQLFIEGYAKRECYEEVSKALKEMTPDYEDVDENPIDDENAEIESPSVNIVKPTIH